MNKLRYDESGDTLLEILLALVLMGLVVGAFLATYSTQGAGSTVQRSLVTADGVLRSYAEATKSAVRTQCPPPRTAGANFSVSYTPPSGYSVNPLTAQSCPPSATSSPWAPILLTVTMPNSQTRTLSLVVRSP